MEDVKKIKKGIFTIVDRSKSTKKEMWLMSEDFNIGGDTVTVSLANPMKIRLKSNWDHHIEIDFSDDILEAIKQLKEYLGEHKDDTF